jgi:hypothetical protein
MEGMMEEVKKLSASIFSPTKIIYISYVVLLALKIIPWHSFHVFALLSLAFWIIEVFFIDIIMGRMNK